MKPKWHSFIIQNNIDFCKRYTHLLICKKLSHIFHLWEFFLYSTLRRASLQTSIASHQLFCQCSSHWHTYLRPFILSNKSLYLIRFVFDSLSYVSTDIVAILAEFFQLWIALCLTFLKLFFTPLGFQGFSVTFLINGDQNEPSRVAPSCLRASCCLLSVRELF